MEDIFPLEASPEDAVPNEIGICTSADTATSAMVKLAAKYCTMMSKETRANFGRSLGTLGESCRRGAFPTVGDGSPADKLLPPVQTSKEMIFRENSNPIMQQFRRNLL